MYGKDKKPDAFSSGMRGSNTPAPTGADRESLGAGDGDGDDEAGSVVAEHIHTDDKGHHHLNLTSLAEHLGKHGLKRA
jgi:hypothetical protein